MEEFISPQTQLAHLRLAVEVAGIDVPEVVLPTERHVLLGNRRFHYVDWGTAGMPPLVFLHGGGQTARTWDLPCLALRGRYRCLALDQRGHGDSEWSYEGDYGPDAHVEDVERFVDHLELERFVLVGLSLGCINSLFYAVRNPERVAALVAVDAGPAIRIEGGESIISFRTRTHELDSIEDYVNEAVRFNPRRDPRLLRLSLLHNLRRLPNGRWTWKTDQRIANDVAHLLERMRSLWGDLGRIRSPVLVLRGAESDVFLDDHAERLTAALPDARWSRIEGAGHTIHGDNPRAFIAAVVDFLGSAPISS